MAGESNASSSSEFKDGEIRDVVKVAIRESLKEQGKSHEEAYEVIYANQNTSNVDHNSNSIIIICGTAFIMSEARAEIGIIEANDGDIVSDNNPHSQFKHAQVSLSFPLVVFSFIFLLYRKYSPSRNVNVV